MANKTDSFHSFESDPDGVMWLVGSEPFLTDAYCVKHRVPLEIIKSPVSGDRVFCPIDGCVFGFTNIYSISQRLAFNLVAREGLKDYQLVRIDSTGNRVIAKEKIQLLKEWWIEAKASDGPGGVQLMVQLGRTDAQGKKVQMFVDAPRERLGFDISGKDTHPAGVLATVNVQFNKSEATIRERYDK